MPPKFLGLNEGEEMRGGETQASEQENIDPLIGFACGEVPGKTDLGKVR